MSTKETILICALDLFNEFGTAKVSTNHIAEKANISIGNLYYHYRDKEHIIREIHEMMINDWEHIYDRIENQEITLAGLEQFVAGIFELIWKYHFLNREITALIKIDPLLKERHHTTFREGFFRQRKIIDIAVDAGLLPTNEARKFLNEKLTICWIIANNYLSHLESMGSEINEQEYKNGADLVIKVLFAAFYDKNLQE